MNTFKNTQYTITTSLNERTVYVKIANNISYAGYEGNFDVEDFQLPFKIGEIYALMNKCFAEMDGDGEDFKVGFELSGKILIARFNCVAMGILSFAFELRLREVVVTEDARMTVELEQHRQIVDELRGKMDNIIAGLREELVAEKKARGELEKTVAELVAVMKPMAKQIAALSGALDAEKHRLNEFERRNAMNIGAIYERLNLLGNAEINLGGMKDATIQGRGFMGSSISSGVIIPINTKTIKIYANSSQYHKFHYDKIKFFYQLESLEIFGSISGLIDTELFQNANVSAMTIKNSGSFGNLEFIRGFPKLRELNMIDCSSEQDAVTMLGMIKHNIKKMSFIRGDTQWTNTINVSQLKLYCDKNGIELVIQ